MLNKRHKKNLRKSHRRKGRRFQRRKTKISSMINTTKEIGTTEEDMITSNEGEGKVTKMIGDIDDVNLLLRIEHYIII